MTSTSISPNWREIISAQSDITGKQEYLKSHNGALNVNATISGTGDVNLTQVGGASITLGQKTMANSFPTTIASDNTGPVRIWDGTNAANVVAGDAGYNGLVTVAGIKTYSFSTSVSGAQTLLADTPTSGYAYVTVIATSVGSGLAWSGQFSPNSGGTYITTTQWENTNAFGQSGAALGTSVSTFYVSPVISSFFQLRVTALSSGTLSGFVILSNSPRQILTEAVTQVGTWTVQPGNTPNTTPWLANPTTPHPSGAVQITGSSGNVANAQAVATLAGTSGKTTYITGFEVTGAGATVGLPVNVTVTGTVTGTLTYTYAAVAGVLLENTPLIVPFPTAIAASAQNTAIVVTCPALGAGNTNNTAVAHGYQL